MTMDTPQITVGLDIGYEAVRLVALERTLDGLVIHRVGAQPFTRPRTPESLFADPVEVVAAIRAVFTAYGSPGWPVVAGLRNRFAMVIRSQIDKSADGKDQYDWLMWEATHGVVDPLDQYIVDVALTGRETKTTQDALIVAARREPVESLSRLLQVVGLTPVALDVATIALVNAFEAAYSLADRETVALVHIEPRASDVIVIRGTTLSNVVAVPLGSDKGAVDPVLNTLGQQLADLLNTFPRNESPDRVLVSGEFAGLPELCKRWADELDRPVTPASPFQRMQFVPALAEMDHPDRWAGFMVATGLALKQPS